MSDVVRALYAAHDSSALPVAFANAAAAAVRCANASFNLVGRKSRQVRVDRSRGVVIPSEEEDPLRRNLHEHPLISYLQQRCDESVVKFSDFMSRRQFHRTNIFNEYYRRTNTQAQMAFGFDYRPDSSVILCVNHVGHRDFSESDRKVLQMLRPHFVQAYNIASRLANLEAGLTTIEKGYTDRITGCVLLSHRLKPVHISGLAADFIAAYFPGYRRDGFPPVLKDWASEQKSRYHSPGFAQSPPQPFVKSGAQRDLVITFRNGDSRTLPMLLLEEKERGPAHAPLQRLGLTAREAEVLYWVGEGKSNPEIALILGAGVRTIHKHMEHILPKLGVETRAAAMLQVRETLRK